MMAMYELYDKNKNLIETYEDLRLLAEDINLPLQKLQTWMKNYKSVTIRSDNRDRLTIAKGKSKPAYEIYDYEGKLYGVYDDLRYLALDMGKTVNSIKKWLTKFSFTKTLFAKNGESFTVRVSR